MVVIQIVDLAAMTNRGADLSSLVKRIRAGCSREDCNFRHSRAWQATASGLVSGEGDFDDFCYVQESKWRMNGTTKSKRI